MPREKRFAKGDELYHWLYGRLVVERHNNGRVCFRCGDIESVRCAMRKKRTLEANGLIIFFSGSYGEWFFDNEKDVFVDNRTDASIKGLLNSMYDTETFIKQSNKLIELKKSKEELRAKRRPSKAKTLLDHLNINENTMGESMNSIAQKYDDIIRFLESNRVSLCEIEKFPDLEFKYEHPIKASHYTYRYLLRYASDAFHLFERVLSDNANIKNILIVGAGNHADLCGLNAYVTEKRSKCKIHVDTVDRTRWGYYPAINLHKSLSMDYSETDFIKLDKTLVEQQDLIILSRISSERNNNGEIVGKCLEESKESAIIVNIFLRETKEESTEEKTEEERMLSAKQNYRRLQNIAKDIEVSSIPEISAHEFAPINTAPLEIAKESRQNYRKKCDKSKCVAKAECQAVRITKSSFFSYEAIQKEGDTFNDYFSF